MMPRIGVAEWTFAGSIESVFEHVAAAGLAEMQVDFGLALNEGASRAARLRSLVRATGIDVTTVGARLLNRLSFSQDASRCRTLIDAVLEFSTALDVKQVFLPIFYHNRATYELSSAAEVLSWACQRAAAAGITLAVESAQGASDIGRLLRAVDDQCLHVVADTYNPQTEGNSYEELIRTHTSVLMPFLHVKDGLNHQVGAVRLGQGDGRVAERLSMGLHLFVPKSVVIESRFSLENASEELRRDVAFVMQHLPR